MNTKTLAVGDAVESVVTIPGRKPIVTSGKVSALLDVEGHPYARLVLRDGRPGFTTLAAIGAKGQTPPAGAIAFYRLA